MLAVLPFENLTGSEDDEYLADGLTEEILTLLGRLSPERLGVIARTSVVRYKKQPRTVREIARELQVDYVLEGSLRQVGGRLRVTAQLIEVESQTHTWAQAYERDLSEAFRVEVEIAQAIAQQLSIQLLPGALAPLEPASREAHVAYLKGLHFWNRRDAASLRRATELFREAIDLDPTYARAHAGLAAAYASLATSADALAAPEARALAEAGAALARARSAAAGRARGPGCGALPLRLELAGVRARPDPRPRARPELRHRAPLAGRAAGRARPLRARSGGAEEGPRAGSAVARHPRQPGHRLHVRRGLRPGAGLFRAGPRDRPTFLLAHRVKGLTLVRGGRVEEGLASLRKARELDPSSAHAAADLGYALARAGRTAEARAVLRELEALARERRVSAYDFAVVHAGLGETEAAVTWLEKAYAERATGVRWVKVDPIFDPLRGEPRFQVLLRSVGLPDWLPAAELAGAGSLLRRAPPHDRPRQVVRLPAWV